MRDSTIYAKWKEQDQQYQRLIQFIQGQYQTNINNMNELILSINALKSILIEKEIMNLEDIEVAIKKEIELHKNLDQEEAAPEQSEDKQAFKGEHNPRRPCGRHFY